VAQFGFIMPRRHGRHEILVYIFREIRASVAKISKMRHYRNWVVAQFGILCLPEKAKRLVKEVLIKKYNTMLQKT
jgi:hypothetical protein